MVRFTSRPQTFQERLAEQKARLEKKASRLKPGPERDDLLKKAQQIDTARDINEWPRLKSAAIGGRVMLEYRAYTIGDDGHFIEAAPLVCDDDDAAIKQAAQLVNGRAIELWSGPRFVIKLEPKRNNEA